ncbi:hypothetical protein E3N88_31073 [Mikania micrantha]|uniref:MYB transcription factor n=1 Tax=Mikania micrantha TaxID=192012 RepID=A0A5N6MPB6_9ASTR|nr:hypothetical protein E3N88_31073 [Mikania micrantha]
MARPKQKWTSEEEEALSTGVEKYGLGRWKTILSDPQFASSLVNRSNVDLKDKWRNLSGSDYGSGSRGNVKTPWMQMINNLLLTSPELSRSSVEKRRAPPYKTMIYETLSSIDDPHGTDVNTMVKFLEPKYQLPKNFRRLLTAKLRKLVLNGDLEKVDRRYKVKRTSSGSQQEDVDNFNEELGEPEKRYEEQVGPQNVCEEQEQPIPTETLEDAASVAAFHLAVAASLEERLIKTSADKDKLAELLQESMAMLMLAQDLYQQCK